MSRTFPDQARINEHNTDICDLKLRTTDQYCTATLALCDFKNKADFTHKFPHISEAMIIVDLYKSIKGIE